MIRENNHLKHELKRHGFDVPRTTWNFQDQKAGTSVPDAPQSHHRQTRNDDRACEQLKDLLSYNANRHKYLSTNHQAQIQNEYMEIVAMKMMTNLCRLKSLRLRHLHGALGHQNLPCKCTLAVLGAMLIRLTRELPCQSISHHEILIYTK
jgi:hypothetical protein